MSLDWHRRFRNNKMTGRVYRANGEQFVVYLDLLCYYRRERAAIVFQKGQMPMYLFYYYFPPFLCRLSFAFLSVVINVCIQPSLSPVCRGNSIRYKFLNSIYSYYDTLVADSILHIKNNTRYFSVYKENTSSIPRIFWVFLFFSSYQ